ncbi:MAG: creatininase family protein [Myxococcota bacterium]|nr:creatininase family protein [Myxococcota bacterium]
MSRDVRAERWREGHALLVERARRIPDLLHEAFGTSVPDLRGLFAGARAVRTTGLGSSSAHARYLAFLLGEHAGLTARFSPTGDFVSGPPAGAGDEALVVFSQALSPNARFALQRPGDWHALVLVTALAGGGASEEEQALLDAVHEAGGVVLTLPGGVERGALLRVAGPLCGYAVALRVAQALGAEGAGLAVSPDSVVQRVERAASSAAGLSATDLDGALALLALGSYGGLATNLALKVVEGLLRPPPPVWDLLDFAHGPLQQLYRERATLLALTREGGEREEELLARLGAVLDSGRHRLLRLPATLPGALAIFEHEARLNRLVLDRMAAEAIDPVDFPARGADGPLYGFAPGEARRLEALTAPEVASAIAKGRTTAVLPLGATEQHGAHLPLATDTWIADALAERVCARLPEALRLPTLPVGCSTEHRGFPGTLSVSTQTLRALLADVFASLAPHGFARVFVFSAHGGNVAPLAEALPALRAGQPDLEIVAFTDLGALTRCLHACSAGFGVSAAAAGHHAGEIETSIGQALWPGRLRPELARPGLAFVGPDAQALFYPSLRDRAPDGVVGDPTAASPERAEVYLRAWADLLVEHYRAATNA